MYHTGLFATYVHRLSYWRDQRATLRGPRVSNVALQHVILVLDASFLRALQRILYFGCHSCCSGCVPYFRSGHATVVAAESHTLSQILVQGCCNISAANTHEEGEATRNRCYNYIMLWTLQENSFSMVHLFCTRFRTPWQRCAHIVSGYHCAQLLLLAMDAIIVRPVVLCSSPLGILQIGSWAPL